MVQQCVAQASAGSREPFAVFSKDNAAEAASCHIALGQQNSRTQSLNFPTARPSSVPEPIMEPALAALPKLDHVWNHSQPSPKVRHWNLFDPIKLLLYISNLTLQYFSAIVAILTRRR